MVCGRQRNNCRFDDTSLIIFDFGKLFLDILNKFQVNKQFNESLQAVGASIKDFPNLERWYEQCHVLEGFQENAKGAKLFGDAVKSKLDDTF